MNYKITELLMKLYLFAFSMISSMCLFAQVNTLSKPAIDTGELGKWPRVCEPNISPSGGYISYCIDGQPREGRTLIISDSGGFWKREYVGATWCYFSGDDRQAVFLIGDSLHFLMLGKPDKERVIEVRSIQYPSAGRGEWLAYEKKATPGQLVLFNLLEGKETYLKGLSDYMFERSGKALLLKDTLNDRTRLYYLDLNTGLMKKIWTGEPLEKASDYHFDAEGDQIVYTVKGEQGNKQKNSIWYYKRNSDSAELKLRDGDIRIDSDLQIIKNSGFSKDGHWIFFMLQQKPETLKRPGPDAAMVDIWSYRDIQLQPEQLISNKKNNIYRSVLATEGNSFIQLDKGEERLAMLPIQVTGDMVIINRPDSSGKADPIKDLSYPPSYYLMSLKNGSKKLLQKKSLAFKNFYFSPENKWLVYYDEEKRNYFSYNILTGRFLNLTGQLPARFTSDLVMGNSSSHPAVSGVAGWVRDDSSLLLYDNYDLWKIDPAGHRPGLNVTAGYGLMHHVKLRLLDNGSVYSIGDTLLFTGFNTINKYNGFFQQVLASGKQPELLTMGPYTYYKISSQNALDHSFNHGMSPIRASLANYWVVERQSATEAPNYFFTHDFKSYNPLSHLAPQTNFNWLTTELITYKQLDGTMTQGILYKPENFDPSKKYPVIFNYYEQLSHRLYEFLRPEFTRENINIPWFVSQGYLVFTPDIHYKLASLSGRTAGQWACNSIIAAAQTLASLPYVNGQRMGLQGHSFGAEETNYLITHSHLFAAAAEMAGVSDMISSYLTLAPSEDILIEDRERQRIKESGQDRLGVTLWQRPDLYLEASAVLHADRITTPLLIVHNKGDDIVQWRQGVELYLALRRLQKRAWMLQYDEETHEVLKQNNAVDYTIRVTQFFDHYLKGRLPPKWMTNGIPVRLKGLENGYEQDKSGRIP
ncbi:MAG TPA: prolyl oligopeptidase family serine peptidase [Puia sp.]|jgi:dipeptidyl aminopeptidase/acylaminoacyl peptidase